MFHYYKAPDLPGRDGEAYVATLPAGLSDVRTLLTDVGRALRFPPYYGKNFDAFWDCVRDLDVEKHVVVLVHRDLPDIPEKDLRTYIELLRDAVLYWRRHGGEHRFEVWFPEADAERVDQLLCGEQPRGDGE